MSTALSPRFVLAVDGPGGVGKSAVSRGVARQLGLRYLDTGAMYRAVTWALLETTVDLDDQAAIADAAHGVEITSGHDPDRPTIHVGDVDVSGPIRGPEVTAAVSAVSAVPQVRALMVARQRAAIAASSAEGGIVVEGRDIGTVVVPDAPLKIYLTADEAVRAQRRRSQRRGRDARSLFDVQRDLARRDAHDSGRSVSPMSVADDAVVIDTTNLSLDQVIDRVRALALDRGAERVRG